MGLLTWVFYQMYTGNIYEAGGFVTAMNYYYLLFVAAYLTHLANKKKEEGAAICNHVQQLSPFREQQLSIKWLIEKLKK